MLLTYFLNNPLLYEQPKLSYSKQSYYLINLSKRSIQFRNYLEKELRGESRGKTMVASCRDKSRCSEIAIYRVNVECISVSATCL